MLMMIVFRKSPVIVLRLVIGFLRFDIDSSSDCFRVHRLFFGDIILSCSEMLC